MELKITFGDGKKVSTQIGEHVITTDQPTKYGGVDSAPAPYDLFLASIATCAGFFVKSYCDNKGIEHGTAMPRRLGSRRMAWGWPGSI